MKKKYIIIASIGILILALFIVVFCILKVDVLRYMDEQAEVFVVECGSNVINIDTDTEKADLVEVLSMDEWENEGQADDDITPEFYICVDDKYLLSFYSVNNSEAYCSICFKSTRIQIAEYKISEDNFNNILNYINGFGNEK